MALWDDVKQHTNHSIKFYKVQISQIYHIDMYLERNNKLVKTYTPGSPHIKPVFLFSNLFMVENNLKHV